jgi:hypothetical protein
LVGWKVKLVNHTTAIFRQVNKDNPRTHHDALEFPGGQMVPLNDVLEGQEATVLQLPAQPVTPAEIKAQERVNPRGARLGVSFTEGHEAVVSRASLS